jgi:hypothetical protein
MQVPRWAKSRKAFPNPEEILASADKTKRAPDYTGARFALTDLWKSLLT